VNLFCDAAGISLDEANLFMEAFVGAITEALSRGEKVSLDKWGDLWATRPSPSDLGKQYRMRGQIFWRQGFRVKVTQVEEMVNVTTEDI
jgi:hypothetical protein